MRHVVWDHAKIPNQNDKQSMLELDSVKQTSEGIVYGAAAVSAILALAYYTV